MTVDVCPATDLDGLYRRRCQLPAGHQGNHRDHWPAAGNTHTWPNPTTETTTTTTKES